MKKKRLREKRERIKQLSSCCTSVPLAGVVNLSQPMSRLRFAVGFTTSGSDTIVFKATVLFISKQKKEVIYRVLSTPLECTR